LSAPNTTGKTRLSSVAAGDTMGFLGDTLKLTLGVRDQRLKIDNYAYGSADLLSEYSKSRVSPLAAVLYKLDPKVSLYANYAEQLSQGDTAPATHLVNGVTVPTSNANEMLSPYVSKQTEIGAKYQDGRIGGGVALFSITKPRGMFQGDTFTSSGEDRHRGLELTAYGKPLQSLKILGGLTLLDAVQRSTGDATTEGKRVIGVPRTQASLSAEWAVTGVEGLAVDGRLNYTGSSYADSQNTLKVPSWTRFDLGARYELEVQDHLVTLRARVENIANRSYWASAGGYPDNGYLVVGAPRTFSLSASVDF